jgi:hypothetical protein
MSLQALVEQFARHLKDLVIPSEVTDWLQATSSNPM